MSPKPRFLHDIGQLIPGTPYLVRAHLGVGGLGMVYDVVEQPTSRVLALKMAHPDLLEGTPLRARLRELGAQLIDLAHENIGEVYGCGETGNPAAVPFLLMERLQGHTLARVLRRLRAKERLLPLSRVFTVMAGLLSALDRAHSRGVTHGAVKPANLFLHERPEGRIRIKLVDFGTQRILDEIRRTRDRGLDAGRLVEARGSWLELAAADIFASGAVLYEILSLRSLAEDAGSCAVSGWRAVPPELDALLARMLDERPERRPNAAGVLAELDAIRRTLVETGSLQKFDRLEPGIALGRPLLGVGPSTPTRTSDSTVDENWDLPLEAEESPLPPMGSGVSSEEPKASHRKRQRWWLSPEANQHVPDWIQAAATARQGRMLRLKRLGASAGLGSLLASMVLVPSYRAWWPFPANDAMAFGGLGAVAAATPAAGPEPPTARAGNPPSGSIAAPPGAAPSIAPGGSPGTPGTKWVRVSDVPTEGAPAPNPGSKPRDRESQGRPRKPKPDDSPIVGLEVVESP